MYFCCWKARSTSSNKNEKNNYEQPKRTNQTKKKAHAIRNSIAVGGNANDINSFRAIQEMIGEVAAQRKMTEKALEQVERLVGVIEKLSNQN